MATILREKLVKAGRLPVLHFPGDVTLRVVATEGGNDDWSAYAHRADDHDTQAVADHGFKRHRDDAVELFPIFRPTHYRA